MNVKINRLSSNQIEVEIEIPQQQMESYFQLAASEISKNLKVNGFRPGKVPPDIVEEKLGSQKLYDEAANLAVSKTFPKAIVENKIEIIGQPDIVVTQIAKGNSMKYRAKIWIIPEIKLANYKGLEIKRKKIEVEPEEIDHEFILKHAQIYLGEVKGYYTDWTPLQNRASLFTENLDWSDPWQFSNIRVE